MAPELAIIRSIGFPRQLRTPAEEEDFEQELVDQWALALAADWRGGLPRGQPADHRGGVRPVHGASDLDGPAR